MNPVLLLCTAVSALGAALPFAWIKPWADRLASDGSMERMTPEFWLWSRLALGVLALGFLCLSLWRIRSPRTFSAFFRSLLSLPARFFRDIPAFLRDFLRFNQAPRWERALLWLIFIGGTVIRLLVLDRPLLHDEAYSMAIWGRSDLYFAVSDYHLPNNHLFHSVLVNLIYHRLGKEIWMLRLPVFFAGIGVIPLAAWLGKKFYSRTAGVLAAGLCSFAPFLILYSSNARGYEMQAFFTLLTVLLAAYVKGRKNIFAWGLFILFSALNFFTLPIALYPFGGICLWFLLFVLSNRTSAEYGNRWGFFKYLMGSGLSVTVLTMALHLPLFKESGLDSFFGNQYVGSVIPGTFWATSASRLLDSYHAFCDTWPLWVWIPLFAGCVVMCAVSFQADSMGIPYGLGLLLCMAAVMSVQKPNLWPRTVLFLHPLLILWGAGGLCWLTRSAAPYLTVLLICSAAWSQFPAAWELFRAEGPDEQAIRLLMETEGEAASDVFFVTAAEDNAPLWIYADREGLPKKIFDKNQRFSAVYALVNPRNDAYNGPVTLEELMEGYSPGQAFVNMNTGEILMNDPDAILYRFEVYLSAIEKAFGN